MPQKKKINKKTNKKTHKKQAVKTTIIQQALPNYLWLITGIIPFYSPFLGMMQKPA